METPHGHASSKALAAEIQKVFVASFTSAGFQERPMDPLRNSPLAVIDASPELSHCYAEISAMPEVNSSQAPCPAKYWLTRFVILRLLGCVYAVAFLAAAYQVVPLIGSHGLLPVDLFLQRVQLALGSST